MNAEGINSVAIVYEKDIRSARASGIATFIRTLFQKSKIDEQLYIGIQSAGETDFNASFMENIRFVDVLQNVNEEIKPRLPRSLHFVLSAKRIKLPPADVYIFNRLEHLLLDTPPGTKRVLIIHNDIEAQVLKGKEVHWSKIPFLYKMLERALLKKCDLIFSVNQQSLTYLERSYPSIAHRCLPTETSFNEEIFFHRPASETSRELFELTNKTYFLFVGRLEKQKNLPLLIGSFARVAPKEPIDLLVIGEGSQRAELETLVESLNLKDRVHMPGALPQNELPAVISQSIGLCLTSDYEGMPTIALESIACGTPVLATHGASLDNVLVEGKNGIFCESNTERVAEGLIRLIESTWDRQEIAEEASKHSSAIVVPEFFDRIKNFKS